MPESEKHSVSTARRPFPEDPVLEGVRTLPWDEIAALLQKFPARDRVAPLPSPSFLEFDILQPGMRAYERFRRRLRIPSYLRLEREPAGFLIREKNLDAFGLFVGVFIGFWVFAWYFPLKSDAVHFIKALFAFGGAALTAGFIDFYLVEKRCFFFTEEMCC